MSSTPLEPALVADRFAPLGRELVGLLHHLGRGDWDRPTIAGRWRVRDVAAHLLDTACRRVSLDLEGVALPPPDTPLRSDADLVAYLNRRNEEWVEAMRRIGPRLLTEWIDQVEPPLSAVIEALDPWAAARFGVSWAGEESSVQWFDTARELTERWHHQEQIRLAVGAPSLDDPFYLDPVMETFLRVLPFRYREVEAPPGTRIGLQFTGRSEATYTLRRAAAGWELRRGCAEPTEATLEMATSVAWRLLTKGLQGAEAREASKESGRADLLDPFFGALAIVG